MNDTSIAMRWSIKRGKFESNSDLANQGPILFAGSGRAHQPVMRWPSPFHFSYRHALREVWIIRGLVRLRGRSRLDGDAYAEVLVRSEVYSMFQLRTQNGVDRLC